MSVGDFKAHFSDVLKMVMAGEEIAIQYGRKKEIVAMMIPKTSEPKPLRKLGILEGKGSIEFATDFKITEEEFLGL